MSTQTSCSSPHGAGPHHAVVPVVVFPDALAAAREHAAVAAGGLDHDPPFADRQRFRLLAVHVLAVPHRLAGDQRVPVVGRGAEHRVDVRPGTQLAVIVVVVAALVRAAGLLLGIAILDLLLGPLPMPGVHVADGQDLDFREAHEAAHVAAALAAHADEAHGDAVAGRRAAFAAQGRGRDDVRGRRCRPHVLQEPTPRYPRFLRPHGSSSLQGAGQRRSPKRVGYVRTTASTRLSLGARRGDVNRRTPD